MDLTFDPYSWHRPAHDSARGGVSGSPRLDWHVLAARLAAAHAFQRHGSPFAQTGAFASRTGLFPASVAGMAVVGSFHRGTAQVLTGFIKQNSAGETDNTESSSDVMPRAGDEARALAGVNPKSSGDRKGASGNGFAVADLNLSGNRGLK